MKKLIVLLALVASLVFATVASASHVNVAANFSSSFYKYSGIQTRSSSDFGWFGTNAGLVMSVQYWSFTAFQDHSLTYYSVTNNDGTAWVQVGLWTGYDPWGNVLVSNYPLGTWTDANHPNDGHDTSKPRTYVPNTGQWRIFRYAEIQTPALGYKLQMISTFPLSSGQTVYVRHDTTNTFSIVDQNFNTLGIANHVMVPQAVSAPGYHIGAAQEDASPGDTWLDDGIYVLQQFQNPTGLFWSEIIGCSGNGWGTPAHNPNDPNCNGGAANQSAPLDSWRQTSPNWQQVQNYCQECQGFSPPFLTRNNAYSKTKAIKTMGVSSDNLNGKLNGKPPKGDKRDKTRKLDQTGIKNDKDINGPNAVQPPVIDFG